jgi:hypothetical protein
MLETHNFFHTLEEPYQSCLLFLRNFILESSENISESWKSHTPFYYYRKKWIVFISYHPKTKVIYIAFVDGAKISHPLLVGEGRKKMKILYIDPEKDIEVRALKQIMKKAIDLKS